MIYPIVSIRDRKTCFMTPTVDTNLSAAVRNFSHAVQNADTVLYSHAQDFSLYHIGDFDADTGILTPVFPVKFLCEAQDFVSDERRGGELRGS